MSRSKKSYLKIIAVVVWITFTLALAGWWFIFALRLVNQSPELKALASEHLIRQHRMLIAEGAFLFLMLLVGGIALLYYISRENKRSHQIQIFFSSFTHDLKTSLASLRLQAESLEEDLKGAEQEKLLKRLVKDTVRLQLQLENSLFVANPEAAALHLESIELAEFIRGVSLQWPEIEIRSDVNSSVIADPRALESVLKNLIQNSVVHGRATSVHITSLRNSGMVILKVSDNGTGFKGDLSKIGEAFHKHHGSSGSGVGLYLVKLLIQKMNGSVRFIDNAPAGFSTEISLPVGQS